MRAGIALALAVVVVARGGHATNATTTRELYAEDNRYKQDYAKN